MVITKGVVVGSRRAILARSRSTQATTVKGGRPGGCRPGPVRLRAAGETPSSSSSSSSSSVSFSSASSSSVPAKRVDGFVQLERLITERARESGFIPEDSGWELVEGCWVLPCTSGEPKALVHFIGGAFAGASPQLTYRYFLEQLASKGFLVVATPFETNFEHLKIADDIHLKYTQCVRALGDRAEGLQTIGVGHSMGALQQLLMCSRYKDACANRAGNVMISFNNKPVTDAIPFYYELIAPASSQLIAPLLQQLGNSPQAKVVEEAVASFRGQTPEFIQKNLFPLIDQLQPIYEDIAQDRMEFSPTPDESKQYVAKRYTCSRNLLVKFSNDTIDETSILAETLQKTLASMQVGGSDGGLELTVKQLAGDHVTPCKQPPALVEQGVSQFSAQSKDFLGSMASIADMATGFGTGAAAGGSGGSERASNVNPLPFPNVSEVTNAMQRGIDQITTEVNKSLQSASEVEQVDQLVQVITQWSGVEPRVTRRLPPPSNG